MNISKKIHPQAKSLLRLLRTTADTKAPHQADDARHPSAVYAISLSQTLRRIEDVIEQLSGYTFNVQLNTGVAADEALAGATEALILQVDRHLDDCAGIVAAYTGADSEAYLSLLDSIDSFAEVRHLQANRIRYYDAKIRLVSFKAPNVVVSGFYFEGPDSEGVLGPCPIVHQCRNLALSYNLYLRRVFAEINLLNSRVYDVLRKEAGLKEGAPEGPSENMEITVIAGRLATLGLHVFPDELKAQMPSIAVKSEDGMDTASITVPSLKKPLPVPAPCSISISRTQEGGSHYREPYLTQGAPQAPSHTLN